MAAKQETNEREGNWERDLDQLRKDFLWSLEKAQAEIDRSFDRGKKMVDQSAVNRIRREMEGRAAELRKMVLDYEGTGKKILDELKAASDKSRSEVARTMREDPLTRDLRRKGEALRKKVKEVDERL